MTKQTLSRRGMIAGAGATRATDVRRNISSFAMQDWRDPFDTLGPHALYLGWSA